MKKARILSLLLAAVMTASSLPVVTSAAGADAENYAAAGELTASGAITAHDADQSGYLSVGNRWKGAKGELDGRSQSLVYAYNFKYGTKYRITFDTRLGVPASSDYSFRVQSSGHGNTDYQQRSIVKYANAVTGQDKIIPSGSFHWFNLPTNPGAFDAVNTKWKTDYPAGSEKPSETIYNTYVVKSVDGVVHSDNVPTGALKDVDNPSWKTFTFEYEYAAKPADATSDTVLGYVGIYGGKGGSYSQAFDMDNFILEEYKDGAWVEIESYDFNTEVPMGGSAGTFTKGYGWTPNHANAIHSIVHVEDGDTAYNRVAATDGVNTEITYSVADTVLTPGIYSVSADLRYAYSTCTGDPKDRCNVTMTLGEEELATALVTNAWTTLSNSIAVYEETALSDITFAADAAVALDVKSVSVELTSPLSGTVASDDLTNGATATFTGLFENVESENGFVSFGPLKWDSGTNAPTNYGWIKLSEKIVVGRTYYVGLMARFSTPSDSGANYRVYSNSINSEVQDKTGANTTYLYANENTADGDRIIAADASRVYLRDVWKYNEFEFTPTNEANVDILIRFQRGMGDETQPMDIDDFKVWYMDGEDKVVVYENNFDNPSERVVGTSSELDVFYGDTKTGVAHCFEDNYTVVTATAGNTAGASYDLSNLNIGGGIYTLDVSLKTNLYRWKKETAQYLTNYYDATVTLEFADNSTKNINTKVGPVWNKISNTVIIPEGGATIKAVNIDTAVDSTVPLLLDVALAPVKFGDLTVTAPETDNVTVKADAAVDGDKLTVTYDVDSCALTDTILSVYANGGIAGNRTAQISVVYTDGRTESANASFALPTEAPIAVFSVLEGDTVDKIVVTTTVDALTELDYALTAMAEAFGEFDNEEDEDNALGGATLIPNNVVVEKVEVEPYGHLYVGERTAAKSGNFLTIPTDAKVQAGVLYYVSMDINTDDGKTMNLRPALAFDTQEYTGARVVEGMYNDQGMNGRYLIPSEGNTAGYWWGNTSTIYKKLEDIASTLPEGYTVTDPIADEKKNGIIKDADGNKLYEISYKNDNILENGKEVPKEYVGKNYPVFSFGGSTVHIVGEFTPVSDNTLKFVFTRGTSDSYIMPLNIDNLKVWTMDGDEEVVVYENNFDFDGAIEGITTTAAVLKHDYTVSREVFTPVDTTKPAGYTIVPTIAEEAAVTGAYVFSTTLRTAEDVGEKTVTISYNYTDNGESFTYTETTTIDKEWTNVILSKTLPKSAVITGVVIEMENPVAFEILDYSLRLRNHLHDGTPNFGVVMMLLYKKAGGVKKIVKEVDFVENGDLEIAPVINNEVYPKVQTAAEAGFWAKDTAARTTTLEYVTEDGNSFVRVKDLVNSQRGVWWNSGVELEPGTYTFTVDLRISEQADAAHYTEYKWRSDAKDHMFMRTMLQNPNGVGSGNYAPFEPVDLDTAMNNSGNVVGVSTKITREWTTYTDTITIDKPVVAIFKIGGGTGGDPDSHGFDIDNLSIVGNVTYYTKNGEVVDLDALPEEVTEEESGAPSEPTAAVSGNLITNGDFDEEPTIIAGETYDETKANAWFQNDGMAYDTDANGQAMKDQGMIPFNHKITWTDGYLTFSGRENNLRNFWYNSGVTAEPGTYKLTIDFKTAKEGETSSIRAGVQGLFSPKVTDALTINNEWNTMTIGFTVTEATPIRINFWGGAGAAYTHDFCVDNVVLTKIA